MTRRGTFGALAVLLAFGSLAAAVPTRAQEEVEAPAPEEAEGAAEPETDGTDGAAEAAEGATEAAPEEAETDEAGPDAAAPEGEEGDAGGEAGARPDAAANAPRVWLVAETDCPGAEAVGGALGPWVQPAEGPEGSWRVTVQRREGTARLLLHEPGGDLALEQRLESEDCGALARTFAFLVQLRFADLGLLPGQARDEALARHRQRGGLLEPPEPEPEPEPEEPPEPPPSSSGLWVALGGGGEFTLDPSLGMAAVAITGGWRPGGGWIAGRLSAHGGWPTEQSAGGETVELLGGTLRAEIAVEGRIGAFAVRPGAGLGVVLRRVTARSSDGEPSQLRTHPLVSAALPIVWRATPLLGVRFEVVMLFMPIGDRYVVEPIGPIARSPRLSFLVLLGLELHAGE